MNNSSLTSNYIRVRSGRDLKRQNQDSKQIINKAGSNDTINQPGSVGISNPRVNPTGVNLPQTITSGIEFGYNISTYQAGEGKGGVAMPPLKAPPVLTSNDLNYPFSFSQRWRHQNLLLDPPLTDIDRPNLMNNAGSIDLLPAAVTTSGTMSKELVRTSGIDGDRQNRTKDRRRNNSRRR